MAAPQPQPGGQRRFVLHLVRAVPEQAPGGLGDVQPVGPRLQTRQRLGGLLPGGSQQVLAERRRGCAAHGHCGGGRCRQRAQQGPPLEVLLRAAAAKEGAEALGVNLVHRRQQTGAPQPDAVREAGLRLTRGNPLRVTDGPAGNRTDRRHKARASVRGAVRLRGRGRAGRRGCSLAVSRRLSHTTNAARSRRPRQAAQAWRS
jgi:hypothetical protein